MAGYYGVFLIEWKCLKPEVHNEFKGTIEWMASSCNDAREKFLELNPDYIVISVNKK